MKPVHLKIKLRKLSTLHAKTMIFIVKKEKKVISANVYKYWVEIFTVGVGY